MKKFRIYSWREVEAEDAFSADFVSAEDVRESKDFICGDVSKVSGSYNHLHEAPISERGYDIDDIVTMLSMLDLTDDEIVHIADQLSIDVTVTAYIEEPNCHCEP